MLVLSSPSGAGKTTLSRNLLEQENIDDPGKLELSVSATTRPRRPSEIDGVHYHFVGKRQFEAMRDRGELLEWAEVHGNYYGTPRDPVEKALSEGRDVLFDIDWQGTRQLLEKMRDDVVTRVRAAAVGAGIEGAAHPPRRGQRRGHRRAADATRPRNSCTGTSTTTSWSIAISTRASRGCARFSPPSG